jgi:FkbM family methyltransferase
MSEHILELRFVSGGVERVLRLRLDQEQRTQQLMLESVTGGGSYEPETASLLLSTVREGDVFIDVGAHIGYFSLLAGMLVGPTGHVMSFEPDYVNFDHLLGHLQDNGLTNVRPLSWAVGDSTRIIDFYLNLDNDGGHAVWNVGAHSFNTLSRATVRRQPVYQTSLDDALLGTQFRIRALKVDTEGNELAVIHGAPRTLTESDPLVVLEVNRFGLNQLGANERELRAYMVELGFDAYALPAPGQLTRLDPEHTVAGNLAFNLAFMRPSLADELIRTAPTAPTWSLNAHILRE